jgi:MFS family permease
VENSYETVVTKNRFYYGWLVVGVGFIIFLLMYGTRFSFGLYIKPLSEFFATNRASISGSQSLYMGVYAFFSLVAGSLADIYGPKKVIVSGSFLIAAGMLLSSQITSVWHYYLTYGILVAIGSGAINVPTVGAVSKLFNRRRNFAIGITTAGAGFGHFIIPLFVQKTIEVKGWQIAFFYIGLLFLIFGVSLPLILLRGRGQAENAGIVKPEESSTKAERRSLQSSGGSAKESYQKHYSLRQAMATRPFWTFFFAYFIFCFIIDGTLLVHLPPYLTDKGFTARTAAKAFSYIGLISTVSMIVFGPLGDKVNKRILMTIMFGVHAFIIYWLIHIHFQLSLWGITIVYGIFIGIMIPLNVSILSDIFGSRNVSSILGAVTIAYGFAGLIAPWLAGYTFDLYHSYIPFFYLAIFLSFIGSICIFNTKKKI